MKREKLLLFNSIIFTIYVVVSIIYYLSAGDSLGGHPIFAALYFWFVVAHEIMMFVALIGQWLAYFYKSRGWLVLNMWFVFLGGLMFFISLLVLVPMIILNLIAMGRKEKTIPDKI